MKSYSPEPLSPEERELARLTGQLGPQGEPSTTLDARILAAAHAALERRQPLRRKPRWPVAMGLAASVVFAVGIAWQLRPLQQTPMAASSEAPAGAAEQEAVADSATTVAIVAPQPLPEAALAETTGADETAHAEVSEAPQSAPVAREQHAPPAPAKIVTAPTSESRARQPRQFARPSAKTSEPADQARMVGNLGAGYSPPAPPAPPAPVAMTAAPAAPAADASIPTFAPDPQEGYPSRVTDAYAPAASAGAAAAKPQADAMAEAKAARASSSARQKESPSLDRVEVTGSRMKRTDLQVPVSADARLPVNEWLERVRTRYGLGDAGAAKQSLLLFVKDHPSEPVPGDLEPLLEE